MLQRKIVKCQHLVEAVCTKWAMGESDNCCSEVTGCGYSFMYGRENHEGS